MFCKIYFHDCLLDPNGKDSLKHFNLYIFKYFKIKIHLPIGYSNYSSIGYPINIEATKVLDVSIILESIQVLDLTRVLWNSFP